MRAVTFLLGALIGAGTVIYLRENQRDLGRMVKDTADKLSEQPIMDRMQPLQDRVQPLLDRMQPLQDQVQPMLDRVQPLWDRIQPLRDRMQPLLDKLQTADKQETEPQNEPATGTKARDKQTTQPEPTRQTDKQPTTQTTKQPEVATAGGGGGNFETMLDGVAHRQDIPDTPVKAAFEEALHPDHEQH